LWQKSSCQDPRPQIGSARPALIQLDGGAVSPDLAGNDLIVRIYKNALKQLCEHVGSSIKVPMSAGLFQGPKAPAVGNDPHTL
jgi:hypothetical protein